MNVEDCVLSRANIIGEVEKIKKALDNLPTDYNPFPEMGVDIRVGVMGFRKAILLTPMVGKNNIYNGSVSFPIGAKLQFENYSTADPSEVVIAGKFSFEDIDYVLYRTEEKHRNP